MRRRTPLIPVDSPLYKLIEYILLVIGCFLVAASFNVLLLPNQIASGGVSGLSVIAEKQWGIEPAITQWALNIPLFFAGVLLLGRAYGLKTAVGSVVLPLFVWLTSDWQPMTENPLLAAIFGGIGVGAGIGVVFRGRGSTGGLSVAASILHKFSGLSLGHAVAVFDGLVIVGAGIVFGLEQALYALIGLFITSKVIDVVQLGLSSSKVAFIISQQPEKVAKAVLYELDRGLTKLSGRGGFTDESRTVLMVVVGQTEVTKLKAFVMSLDPNAFIIISNASEVLGEGFKLEG